MKIKKTIFWIAVVFWASLIFYFSSQNAQQSGSISGLLTSKLLKMFSAWISDPGNAYFLGFLHNIIRKTAHFLLYFVFGALLCGLLKCYTQKTGKIFLTALVLCFFYALSDEVHQYFVPGRAASIIDVFIDTSGALLSIIICLCVRIKKYIFHN